MPMPVAADDSRDCLPLWVRVGRAIFPACRIRRKGKIVRLTGALNDVAK